MELVQNYSHLNVLIVEDETDLCELFQGFLSQYFQVSVAANVAQAKNLIDTNDSFDFVLLDINLPDGSGYEICEKITASENHSKTQVIFISGNADSENKVKALSLGGVDYIEKPIQLQELLFKIISKANKLRVISSNAQIIQKGNIKINLGNHHFFIKRGSGYKEIKLTPTEFKLMSHFVQNTDSVISRDDLKELLWSKTENCSNRTVDAFISKLRKKLVHCSFQIRPKYGKGYVFEEVPRLIRVTKKAA